MDRTAAVVLRGLITALAFGTAPAFPQTTSGTSATTVVPVIAQTASFSSEVTAYKPNAGAITANMAFYDANNTSSPGPKTCTPLSLAAARSAQFSLAGQCALPAGSNFGLLIPAEQSGTQRFYGYARTQTPGGVGRITVTASRVEAGAQQRDTEAQKQAMAELRRTVDVLLARNASEERVATAR